MSREIGQAIKAARERADLSQEELGKLLTTRNGTPLARTKISSYERGEYIPEPRLRPRLAEVLEADEVELFGQMAIGPERDSVVSRLAKVEKRLAAVERVLRGQGLDLVTADAQDAEEAAQAAEEADLPDEESGRRSPRSDGKAPSKGRRR